MNMIISPTDFLYNGSLFFKGSAGRCYRLAEPSGLHNRAARKGLLVSKRVSLAYYNECLEECKAQIAAENAA